MRILPVGAAFGHTFNSTLNNLKFAFHVSWPWMILLLPVSVVSDMYFRLSEPVAGSPPPIALMAIVAIASLIQVLGFASIAVSWHRYILKDEIPQTVSARLRFDGVVWRYVGNTILIWLRVLGMMVLGYLPMLVPWLISSASPTLGAILIVVFFVAFLAYAAWLVGAAGRWSVKLVGIAVGNDLKMNDTWRATEGSHWQITGLYLLFVLCLIVVGFVVFGISILAGSANSTLSLVFTLTVQTLVNWVMTIWGVTLLTSLYGFFIEKREF